MRRNTAQTVTKRRTVPRRVSVTVRLPGDVVARIDRDLDDRDVPLSRNNWLLEAAIEKLRRNDSGGSHGTK